MNPLIFGIVLLTLGSIFFLLTLLVARALPRLQPFTQAEPTPPVNLDIESHAEAVILVEQGGRVTYLNQKARELFHLWEEDPNLESLARRTRPSETFIKMCASESQARLNLNGQFLDATSYFAPNGNQRAILVTMRQSQWALSEAQDEKAGSKIGIPAQVFSILTELSQAITASLDLEETLETILKGVERLVPADISEINLWDADQQHLIPYRFTGLPGASRQLQKTADRYTPGQGYSGYLINHRQPLLIPDVETYREVQPTGDRRTLPFRSYLGVPLLIAGDFIGTLELGSFSKHSFTANDLEILRILSGQSAVAIHNALLYEAEQNRAMELAGLANLAQTVSALRDPQDLFAQLVESLASLLDVEILGFLIYEENRQSLEGQVPFFGLAPKVIDFYRVPVAPDGPVERILHAAQTIVATNAAQDPLLETLGLQGLAQAAGIHHTVLTPLTSGGRMMGYLQVANKSGGEAFDKDDLRLLAIIAGQVAPIIENAALVHQSQRRAQRAETLRRIASLTSSNASLDEILQYSLLDLSRLLHADMSAIFLLDEKRGVLRLHKQSLFGVSPELGNRLGRIPIDDPEFSLTVTASLQQFISGNLAQARIVSLYRPIVESLEVNSAISVPLVLRDRGIGEIMLGSFELNFFNQSDLLSASTAASQLATAIEQSNLSSQTDQSLRQRVDQMTALTRISRELNTTLDLQHVLKRVFDEVLHTTQADCGSIMLFDLQASAQEFSPPILLFLGDQPSENLQPLERMVSKLAESLLISDFEQLDPAIAEQADTNEEVIEPAHAGIRSALIVPIAYQGQVAGLIHLHSSEPNHFDAAALEISETLAIQAAIALGNAHRYQEQVRRSELLNRRVETLSKLFETTQALQSEQPLEQALETIAYAIQASTTFDVVLISIYDRESQHLQRLTGAGIPLTVMAELRAQPQSWQRAQEVLKQEFCLGRSYFIPHEKMPVKPVDVHTVTLLNEVPASEDTSLWHPDDLLLLPLLDSDNQPLGMISVDVPRDKLRPDRTTIESLEIFGSQAAIAIENHQKIHALASQVESTNLKLEQAEKVALTAQSHLPVLLHKDLQQTLTLQRMVQRSSRIQAGLEIAEIVNRQKTRSDVLIVLAGEILSRMDLDLALVAEPSSGGPRLLQFLGEAPENTKPEALLGQRNPLRHSLHSGEMILVDNLDENTDWQSAPLLKALQTQAFICLPVLSGGQSDSAVLAVARNKLPSFTAEDKQLFSLLARQTAIALQNLGLLEETKRRLREVNALMAFSRQLGSLDPFSILQALVDSALNVVPAADAAMVALWNPGMQRLDPMAARGYANNEHMMVLSLQAGEGLVGQVFQDQRAHRIAEIDFAEHYNLAPENLLRYRDATAGRPPVSSLVLPIIGTTAAKIGDPAPALGVLVLDNFTSTDVFSEEDQALITSLSQQTALSLENAGLYQASEQRAQQLQALTDVATTITSNLQPDELISTLLDQLEVILPYETGTLWLRQRDPQKLLQKMIVRAARGFEDSEQRIGLSVNVEDSQLLHEMATSGQPISVGDIRTDSRFPSFVEQRYLSWLGVPLIASGEVIGVIALEKIEPNFYTHDHIQLATTFAGQAAVGLENADLFQESLSRAQELDQRSQILAMLNRLSSELSRSLVVDHVLEFALLELHQVTHSSSVSAVLFDASGKASVSAEYPTHSPQLPLELPSTPLFEHLRQSLGVFISEDVVSEKELEPLQDFLAQHETRSLLVVPLATGSNLHGLLFIHSDQPSRFNPSVVELARTISNQVAITVQNARLFDETRSLTEDLEKRVIERTSELEREHQRTETLLRVMTELSSSLDLDQVLIRTLNVLNEMIQAGQVSVQITRPGEQGLHRLASVAADKNIHTREQASPLELKLADRVTRQGTSLLIADVQADERVQEVGNIQEAGQSAQGSAMAVPLIVGAESLGSLVLLHPQPGYFNQEQLDMVQAAANQIAVAVNNAELYRLIRDQAEDLGSMLRKQQVETGRSKAILEAVADGVLVTDDQRRITLFNASAAKILDLDRSQVTGRSLENFSGLFGKAGRSWKETIQTWSDDPDTCQPGETFEEQITLDNGSVVIVRLAPVSTRSDFLGTVSIFQDITHLVEVDRLKSEFVATVSHELRTPMTSIKGYVEVLLMGAAGSLSEKQKHFLEIVKTNTERLSVLVNDLLDISRIESGKVTLSIQPVNVDELADEVIFDLRRRSQEENKPVELIKDIPPDIARVVGDLDRLRQVLNNLMENAYHYNTPSGKIKLRASQNGQQVQIDVIDTGLGIPPAEQPFVFERFYRGEGPLALGVSGTGLGLSIVKNLVEMHEGRIWLKSSGVPGEGSTFSFTLPIYKPRE